MRLWRRAIVFIRYFSFAVTAELSRRCICPAPLSPSLGTLLSVPSVLIIQAYAQSTQTALAPEPSACHTELAWGAHGCCVRIRESLLDLLQSVHGVDVQSVA